MAVNVLSNVRKIDFLALAALFIEILSTLRRTPQDKYHPKDDSLRSDESSKDLNTKWPEPETLCYSPYPY